MVAACLKYQSSFRLITELDLKQAVDSVLNQTFRDFEVVVANDGSTDRTSEYLSTLNDPKIHCCESAVNRGGSSARNEGIKRAQGDLVAFLDDDDRWEPSKLEAQVDALRQKNVDLCYTGLTICTFGGKIRRYVFMAPRFADIYKSIMYDNFFGTTSSIMVKKELLEKVGGFDPALPALQDRDLFIRLLKNGCTIHGINKPLLQYHVVDNARNISGSFSRYKAAAEYLRHKHRDSEFFQFLKKRLAIIRLKRYVKSRYFLFGSIKYYSKRLLKR